MCWGNEGIKKKKRELLDMECGDWWKVSGKVKEGIEGQMVMGKIQ